MCVFCLAETFVENELNGVWPMSLTADRMGGENTPAGKLNINSQIPVAPQENIFLDEDGKFCLDVVTPCWSLALLVA